MIEQKKKHYLTNAEFLTEIRKSKNSYCQYDAPEYSGYDDIVFSVKQLTPGYVAALLAKKTEQAKKKKLPPPDPEKFVFRVMTYDHIPDERTPDRTKRRDLKVKTLIFPPFKHYILRDGQPVEVGRSHWKDGAFCETHGRLTNRLAVMIDYLINRISLKPNFRGYSYIDEMRGVAMLQMMEFALRFDESKSDIPNPFAFYTTVINHAFIKVLNQEKKNQDIRDELLIAHGCLPSFTRQTADAMEQAEAPQIEAEAKPKKKAEKKPAAKRGRPRKAKTT